MTSPITIHHKIPIYLQKFEATVWLKWQRGSIGYGIIVQDMEEALRKAKQVIDATLELEALRSHP